MLKSLLFGIKVLFFKKPVTYSLQEIKNRRSKQSNIIIDKNKCILCKTCERVCPSKCINIIDLEKYEFNNKNCCDCKLCERCCSVYAFKKQ